MDIPISQSIPFQPLKVCLYRSNGLTPVEVRDILHKMFGHYRHEEIKFVIAGILGNSAAIEWIEEHQYEYETYDNPSRFAFHEIMKDGLDIFIEFNRKGTMTSVLAQRLEDAGIYTYIVEL